VNVTASTVVEKIDGLSVSVGDDSWNFAECEGDLKFEAGETKTIVCNRY